MVSDIAKSLTKDIISVDRFKVKRSIGNVVKKFVAAKPGTPYPIPPDAEVAFSGIARWDPYDIVVERVPREDGDTFVDYVPTEKRGVLKGVEKQQIVNKRKEKYFQEDIYYIIDEVLQDRIREIDLKEDFGKEFIETVKTPNSTYLLKFRVGPKKGKSPESTFFYIPFIFIETKESEDMPAPADYEVFGDVTVENVFRDVFGDFAADTFLEIVKDEAKKKGIPLEEAAIRYLEMRGHSEDAAKLRESLNRK